MARLIDADALKRYVDELERDKPYILDEVIDEQPTAYDVEKVVAELEHEAKLQKLFEEEFYARHNIAQAHIHRYAEQCYRNKAIEIVKAGGTT